MKKSFARLERERIDLIRKISAMKLKADSINAAIAGAQLFLSINQMRIEQKRGKR